MQIAVVIDMPNERITEDLLSTLIKYEEGTPVFIQMVPEDAAPYVVQGTLAADGINVNFEASRA